MILSFHITHKINFQTITLPQVRNMSTGAVLSGGSLSKRDELGTDQLFFHPDETNRIVHHTNSTLK